MAGDLPAVRVPVGRGLVGACAAQRATIHVPDCYADPRFDREIDKASGFHTHCMLSLPLIVHAPALVGVIYQDSVTGERDRYTLGAPLRLRRVS